MNSKLILGTVQFGLDYGVNNTAGKPSKENIKSVRKFVNSLKLFGYGYSWGGFESLALHQEFRETGNRKYMNLAKDEHLVRLHIGLEDPNDLIADIKQALRHLK